MSYFNKQFSLILNEIAPTPNDLENLYSYIATLNKSDAIKLYKLFNVDVGTIDNLKIALDRLSNNANISPITIKNWIKDGILGLDSESLSRLTKIMKSDVSNLVGQTPFLKLVDNLKQYIIDNPRTDSFNKSAFIKSVNHIIDDPEYISKGKAALNATKEAAKTGAKFAVENPKKSLGAFLLTPAIGFLSYIFLKGPDEEEIPKLDTPTIDKAKEIIKYIDEPEKVAEIAKTSNIPQISIVPKIVTKATETFNKEPGTSSLWKQITDIASDYSTISYSILLLGAIGIIYTKFHSKKGEPDVIRNAGRK